MSLKTNVKFQENTHYVEFRSIAEASLQIRVERSVVSLALVEKHLPDVNVSMAPCSLKEIC